MPARASRRILALSALLLAHAAIATEITGTEARNLYETLHKAGARPEPFAGGNTVEVRRVVCFESRRAPPATSYRCVLGEEPQGLTQEDTISAMQEQAARTESLIATRQLREGRLALDALERQVRAWRQAQGVARDQETDFDDSVRQMQRYLVCEENRARLPAAADTVDRAKDRVLHALRALDTRLLAGWLACDTVFTMPESEPERPFSPDALAQRLVAWRSGPLKVVSFQPTSVTLRGFRDDLELQFQFRGSRDGKPAQVHTIVDRTRR